MKVSKLPDKFSSQCWATGRSSGSTGARPSECHRDGGSTFE